MMKKKCVYACFPISLFLFIVQGTRAAIERGICIGVCQADVTDKKSYEL